MAYRRSLRDVRSDGTTPLVDQVMEYEDEIMAAAEVANYHLNGSFDGQSPNSNNFGIDAIHPGYFGYDDWDDMPSLTGGTVADWIDSATPTNLGGAGGGGFADPMGVGDPAVHVILGFGSYAPDPVVNRIKWEKNNEPEAAVNTEDVFRNSDTRIKFLDTPVVLSPQDDFAARVFPGGEVGTTYSDAVYPFGLTFLEAREFRLLDPASMSGTDESNVAVQQS